MNELFQILRAMVRDELRALRLGDTAVVSAIKPRADGDDNNHHCDVTLRHGGLTLVDVPIATPHIGLVSAPREGDVVLLTYVDGDPNRPVVIGRLYSDEAVAPPHEADELWLSMPPEHATKVALKKDGAVFITAGKTTITVQKDGAIEIAGEDALQVTLKGDATVKADGNVELSCKDASVKASGNISLGEGGGGVITTTSHKCYVTGAALVGSQTVTAKG